MEMLHSLSRSRIGRTLLLLGVVFLAWALTSSFFAVDVTEYGVVTRFGRLVRIIEEPGLQVKLPFPFERVLRLDKRLLRFKPATAEYLTEDKKNILVHSLATWKIADPQRFLETVITRANGEARLADIILAEIGAVLGGGYPFSALISPNGQETQFQTVVSHIRANADKAAQANYGIEVVDVKLRQLNLPEQNKRYVFDRMKAERGKMAMQYRSEGEREAKKIIAAAEREETHIMVEAYKEGERYRGEGDAEAMRIYAKAFGENPRFYKFLRTLQVYEKVLGPNMTVFLPSDAEIFQILNSDLKPKAKK